MQGKLLVWCAAIVRIWLTAAVFLALPISPYGARSPESARLGGRHCRAGGTVEGLPEGLKVAERHIDAILHRTVHIVVDHDALRLRARGATPDL